MSGYFNSNQPQATLRLAALLLTYNEEANIERTLAALHWVPSILVIDSGSTDRTLEILASDPKVTTLHRPFDSFADQCNFGLDVIKSEWVLSLDADYVVTPALAEEICACFQAPEPMLFAGFAIPFRYCIAGNHCVELCCRLAFVCIELLRPDIGMTAMVIGSTCLASSGACVTPSFTTTASP